MARFTIRRQAGWRGGSILALLVLGGCSSVTPGVSPTALPSLEPGASTYISNLYGYSLTLPPGWQVVPASVRWDGISDPGHLEPTVDQMSGPSIAVA